MRAISEVRRFNRFYTNRIGLLAEHLHSSVFPLAEARVLYELANGGEATAADIGRRLTMDKARLSRILAHFRARGLVQSRPGNGRRRFVSLSDSGRAAFAALNAAAERETMLMLEPLDHAERETLVGAMGTIETLLAARPVSSAPVSLRGLRSGDLGWIAHRQALLYHREYGWDWHHEGLTCEILATYAAEFDPAREDAWVAERAGAIVGSVFLMGGEEPAAAKLRLLYVEAEARGQGIGRLLVETCIARARALGYRRLTLWTNDVLVTARRLYLAAGFHLVAEAPHHMFGTELIGQTWTLDLAGKVIPSP